MNGTDRKFILTEEEWRGFAVNFLAVVLGIALTFLCDDMIENHATRNRTKDALRLVSVELQDALTSFVEFEKAVNDDLKAARYFHDNYDSLDAIPADSIARYARGFFMIQTVKADMLADDLIQGSDVIQGFDDFSLLMKISEAYLQVNVMVAAFNSHYSLKNLYLDRIRTPEYRRWSLDPRLSEVERYVRQLRSPDGHYLLDEMQREVQMLPQLERSKAAIGEAIDCIAAYLEQ